MSEIHALSGAYAVDALDDVERARFERHLAECGDCRAEVDSLREAAGLLAHTSEAEPPAGLRDRVLADITTVRPLPPQTPHVHTDPGLRAPSAPGATPAAPATRARDRRRWLAPLAAAAAVVALLGGGAVAWHPWTGTSTEQRQPSALERVLDAPDAERVTQRLDGDVKATLVRSKALNQAVLLTENMPAPPRGKVYEMWLQDSAGTMVPAGLMPDGKTSVLLSGDAADAEGAGITVEPAGGSDSPTSKPVMLFSFENA